MFIHLIIYVFICDAAAVAFAHIAQWLVRPWAQYIIWVSDK